MPSFLNNSQEDGRQVRCINIDSGEGLNSGFGVYIPQVSNKAPVPVLKVSLALGASTEPSWVCAITFLIWMVDLVHDMQ